MLSSGCDIESYLALKSVQFKRYLYNIYIMQRAALKIQHWYFKKKAHLQRQQQLKQGIANTYYMKVKEEVSLTI